MSGILYLVATPIGNLEDISFRAIRILKEVDLIAAEDTRNSIKLLNHYEIKTSMTSYHEFNKYDKAHELVDKLLQGMNIALITDAGTPGISDPGEELVKQALNSGITVSPVPGACAAVNALIISGQNTRRFAFEAFLPGKKKEREEILQTLENETRTIIIYEAPHHLKELLDDLLKHLGNRNLTIVKEITKKHETVFKTNLEEAIAFYKEEEPRGEYVLVIEGKTFEELKKEAQLSWQEQSIKEHYEMYLKEGLESKEAMSKVAKDRGISKRDVYKEVAVK
ncbi:MAG: 16S rRNA (cytidine(1402)-2'-O)-methyltransferase [Lachnospiraceae bacterium]|nr:16S rRNA (cytidine(1402)-2'-O)-methyltransferase [Lachnospiraceae bacterium]